MGWSRFEALWAGARSLPRKWGQVVTFLKSRHRWAVDRVKKKRESPHSGPRSG